MTNKHKNDISSHSHGDMILRYYWKSMKREIGTEDGSSYNVNENDVIMSF